MTVSDHQEIVRVYSILWRSGLKQELPRGYRRWPYKLEPEGSGFLKNKPNHWWGCDLCQEYHRHKPLWYGGDNNTPLSLCPQCAKELFMLNKIMPSW